jgi:hypothetical protein
MALNDVDVADGSIIQALAAAVLELQQRLAAIEAESVARAEFVALDTRITAIEDTLTGLGLA